MTAEHNKFVEMRMALAKAGFVVAAAEYRSIPDIFPAPVIDAKAAVRYLRQHAPIMELTPHELVYLAILLEDGWRRCLVPLMAINHSITAIFSASPLMCRLLLRFTEYQICVT